MDQSLKIVSSDAPGVQIAFREPQFSVDRVEDLANVIFREGVIATIGKVADKPNLFQYTRDTLFGQFHKFLAFIAHSCGVGGLLCQYIGPCINTDHQCAAHVEAQTDIVRLLVNCRYLILRDLMLCVRRHSAQTSLPPRARALGGCPGPVRSGRTRGDYRIPSDSCPDGEKVGTPAGRFCVPPRTRPDCASARNRRTSFL